MKYVDIMWMILGCSDRAVDAIHLKKQNKAAVVLQTQWRGYSARQEMQELMKKIKKAKQDFLENRANATILRFVKGRMARLKIKRIQAAACYIQAYFKMRWTCAYYNKMRRAAITIQTGLKGSLKKKVQRKAKRREYLRREYIPFLKACYKDQSRLYKIDVGPDDEIDEGIKIGPLKLKEQYSQTPGNISQKVVLINQKSTLHISREQGSTTRSQMLTTQ